MKIGRLVCCLVFGPLAVAQAQLEFGVPTATYRSVLQLRNGNRLLVGSRGIEYGIGSTVADLTFLGGQFTIAPNFGGRGSTLPTAAALDPSGNIWIAGSTDSDDFKLVNPIFSEKVPYGRTGFVVELDPTGTQLLFSTFLGTQPSTARGPIEYTSLTALTIDEVGSVYVGGSTGDRDFPTSGEPGNCTPNRNGFGDTIHCSLIAKISPAGKLIYSRLLTATGQCRGGGSSCIGRNHAYATVDSIAVDAKGAVTIGGALGGDYVVTEGRQYPGEGYVWRIAESSGASWKLNYPGADRVLVALDAAGNVNVFGRAVTLTRDASAVQDEPQLFAARVKPDGSGFAYSKVLAQSPDASATGMVADRMGNLYLAGTTSDPEFSRSAGGSPKPGSDFVLKIDSSGGALQPALRLPRGSINTPPSFGTEGALMVAGAGGALLTVPADFTGTGRQAIVAFTNSASHALNPGIFPGALLTLYGFNLPSGEEGLQVQVGGLPARVLYAGSNQINLQVPYRVSRYSQTIAVSVSPGNLSLQVPVRQSIGIFTSDGVHAAALNQDGTVNSRSNPAPGGSVVALFGTGALWPDEMTDVSIPQTASMVHPDVNRFEVLSASSTPLPLLYAGTAPGLINGVFQFNVVLPPNQSGKAHSYGLSLNSRAASSLVSSNAVEVYVK